MRHELKTLPEYFQAVWVGDKPFEYRKNDRGFKERDTVILKEFEPSSHGQEYDSYIGREIEGFIRYLLTDFLPEGYCVFTFQEISRIEP